MHDIGAVIIAVCFPVGMMLGHLIVCLESRQKVRSGERTPQLAKLIEKTLTVANSLAWVCLDIWFLLWFPIDFWSISAVSFTSVGFLIYVTVNWYRLWDSTVAG